MRTIRIWQRQGKTPENGEAPHPKTKKNAQSQTMPHVKFLFFQLGV
jgi:hypothetical protein